MIEVIFYGNYFFSNICRCLSNNTHLQSQIMRASSFQLHVINSIVLSLEKNYILCTTLHELVKN